MTDFKADAVNFKSADGNTTIATYSVTGTETTLILLDLQSLEYDEALADHTARGLKRTATVDENTAGLFGILKVMADGHYDDADATAEADMPGTAMALATGTGSKSLLLDGIARDDSWTWTVGGLLFVSETPGAMTHTPPATASAVRQCIGYAISATIVRFCPNLAYVVNAAA